MASIQLIQERNALNGLKASDDFGDSIVRSTEQLGYVVGQQFTIPEDFTGKVYNEPIYVGGKVRGVQVGTAQYLLVEDKNGQGVRFYPSSLAKMAFICNKDGELTGEHMVANGTAAEFYQGFASVQKAMEAMKGKTLIVKDLTPCRVRRSVTDSTPRTTFIPTIDFVE